MGTWIGCIQFSRRGQKKTLDWNEKRKIVNSILPVHKYKLLHSFLSKGRHNDQVLILNCLPIFLDERTTFLGFERLIYDQLIVKSILEIIPRYCPIFEMIDFRQFRIDSINKKNFEIFLKKSTQLKYLQVCCHNNNCAIFQILENFALYDPEVQSGCLKIEQINGAMIEASEGVRFLKLLPNLKSLGLHELGRLIKSYSEDEVIRKKII